MAGVCHGQARPWLEQERPLRLVSEKEQLLGLLPCSLGSLGRRLEQELLPACALLGRVLPRLHPFAGLRGQVHAGGARHHLTLVPAVQLQDVPLTRVVARLPNAPLGVHRGRHPLVVVEARLQEDLWQVVQRPAAFQGLPARLPVQDQLARLILAGMGPSLSRLYARQLVRELLSPDILR